MSQQGSATAKKCGGGYGNHLDIEKVLINPTDLSAYVSGAVTRYKFRVAHIKQETIISSGINSGVNKNTKLGIMGTTGYSTGVHLHYEIIKYQLNENLKEIKLYLNPNSFSSEYLGGGETT